MLVVCEGGSMEGLFVVRLLGMDVLCEHSSSID